MTDSEKVEFLKRKLKYDIEKINEKLNIYNDYKHPLHWQIRFRVNEYQVVRLKGIRTKCKEILKLLEE